MLGTRRSAALPGHWSCPVAVLHRCTVQHVATSMSHTHACKSTVQETQTQRCTRLDIVSNID